MIEHESFSPAVEEALKEVREEFRESGILDSLAIEGILVKPSEKQLPPPPETEQTQDSNNG